MLQERNRQDICIKPIVIIVATSFLFIAFPFLIIIAIIVFYNKGISIEQILKKTGIQKCLSSFLGEDFMKKDGKKRSFKDMIDKYVTDNLENQNRTQNREDIVDQERVEEKFNDRKNYTKQIKIKSDSYSFEKKVKPVKKARKVKKARNKSESFSSFESKSVFDGYESAIDLFNKNK